MPQMGQGGGNTGKSSQFALNVIATGHFNIYQLSKTLIDVLKMQHYK